jgi:Transposase IS116/IS110/IS902 family
VENCALSYPNCNARSSANSAPTSTFSWARQLTHLDALDELIEQLSAEVEERSRPVEDPLQRLDSIPGVARRTAKTILAEIGSDMTRFPTAAHLASWAILGDLRRLRRKGLITRIAHSQRLPTHPTRPSRGCVIHPAHGRVLAPGLALLDPLMPRVAVESGGWFMLRIVRGQRAATAFQTAFFRAGHAHAGILVTLSLVAQLLAGAASLSGTAALFSNGIWAAAILMPAGFFLSATGRNRTAPNQLIVLVYAGAIALALGVIRLGLGLLGRAA